MQTSPAPSKRLVVWWRGARPRTLGASVVPVLVGTAAARAAGAVSPWRFVGALVVALGLQVGVNYLNDYEDGKRGVDTAQRAGPVRLVASGLASPGAVAAAGLIAIAIAGVAGVLLARVAGWWLLGVGAACIAGAVLYSGGPRPYASKGLGEVSVFVFFGLAATWGSSYVQAGRVTARSWWAGPAVGLLAVAILLVNNLRDIPTDAAAGKRTLAVRMGEVRTRFMYRAAVIGGLIVAIAGVVFRALPVTALLVFAGVPLALHPLRAVGSARGRDLVPVLVQTAALQLVCGLGLAVGLWTG
jgi:1,4-dihydroxy-2-naphthoate octaprenyltransferase